MTTWPDLTPDQQAWELARKLLGSDASVSDIAQRAQIIKTAILTGSITVSDHILEPESDTEMERRRP